MKRFFAISLMLVYLTFSAGIVISYHFCGGKLDEISLFKGPKNCCPDANSEKSCCQNSTLTLKITNDYNSNIAFPDVPHAKFVALIQRVFSSTETAASSKTTKRMFDAHKIKHFGKLPIYITNQVFII